MKQLLKSLIALGIVFISGLAAAQQSGITAQACAVVPNEVLAKNILTLIENGIDEGVGKCLANRDAKFVRISPPSRDFYSQRVVLEANDQVVLTNPVVEGRDAYGPNNDFIVRYEIRRAGHPPIQGALSFARIYEQSYIQEVGCAIIQNDPTVSFIKRVCQ